MKHTKTLHPVDVVIVGGGWAGLLIANELGGRTAQSVLVLERGRLHTIEEYRGDMDELERLVRKQEILDYSKETVTGRHSTRDHAVPVRQTQFFPGATIGGMGEHWGGGCPRYMPDCFEVYTRTV